MGNDEAIIYGDRHGERYYEYSDASGNPVPVPDGKSVQPTEKTYYPNAVKLSTLGGTVSLGIITFDQSTGEQNRFFGDNENQMWDSLWTDLDRRGVNRLIRDLRRMRDRIYGKDE